MVKPWLVSLFRIGKRHKQYIILAVTAVAVFVLFTAQVKAFLIITSLGIVATFSQFYKRVFQAPPVFEFVTLTVVAVSVFYGSLIGALFAAVVTITSEVASQAIDPFTITYIPPRIAIAFVAPLLYHGGMNATILGLLMSVLYNVLQQPVYWLLTDPEKRIKSLYFSSLNIPLNWLIFKFLGLPLFELLKMII